MIHLFGPVNHITAIAISGGPDSMAAINFLNQARKPEKKLSAIYFHHGTNHGEEAYKFLKNYCQAQHINLIIGHLKESKSRDKSWEEFWREQRYTFLHSLKSQIIATAHHLNDVAETYLWGCLHGTIRFINYRQPGSNGPTNIIRPFLLTSKESFINWCKQKQIPYLIDPSNTDITYTRNRIRYNLMPEILKINPGFLTRIRTLLKEKLKNETKL